ncbi:uncharacterized protein LY79DRAFT_560906 [Colletotrichum navitas]|uniref:F-box domain-containing protein n=1 Tax=Colletotrichum navitas TaxID=681940 RepID=A0AAD8V0T8_9PEZI|nr:uncharacterized protein LY79DRAFT_560906 [Colletotrichum navitas]KAK1580595.1 hypothetical protein LY79DRAFT_560906 [Colletotrichum navitas]
MVSLTEFPAELLGQIFRGLPQADLASLCKVQSTLREAAVPLLYENVHFLWNDLDVPPIIQFLRSILIHRDLALHVRHLELLGTSFHRSSPYATPKIPVDTNLIGPLISAIENLSLPYESSWVEQLRAGTMDAFTALLLTRIPKLRSLRIEGNFSQEARLSGNVLRSALCDHSGTNLPGFEDLHTVVSKSVWSRTRIIMMPNTEDLLPLFYLPTLRKLEALIDTPQSGQIKWPISPPRLSNLTSLNLRVLRETSIEQVLRATPCLKSLTWHWVYLAEERELPWGPIINLEMVASALSCVRDTLENLKISASVCLGVHNIDYDSMEVRGDLRSLSAFQLKTLQMPWPFFVGLSIDRGLQFGQVVPTSVEHLIVSEDFPMIEWEDEEMIEQLLEYVGGLQPSGDQLRSLHLVSHYDSFPWINSDKSAKRREDITEVCTKHGVEFRIVQD